MRRWIVLALVAGLAGCSYDASFRDCTVQCSAAAPGCPGGFSCSTAEGMCRADNVTMSCAAVLDGGGGVDAQRFDAGATPDAGELPDAGAMPDAGAIVGMVFVPAGSFVMGSDPGEGNDPDEEPEHTVTLSPYYIDVHEVTNAEWRACVTAGGCTAPSSANSNTRTDYYTNATFDNYPVIYVSWNQASAYCTWAGKRLPTEAEWEKVARGGCEVVPPSTCGPEDERTYPWGDALPTCFLANYNPGPYCVSGGDTNAVGARSPAGDSPYGAQDMAGNVWEWVADWYASAYYGSSPSTDPAGPASGTARGARGGSWFNDATYLRAASRGVADAIVQSKLIGLRCARTP